MKTMPLDSVQAHLAAIVDDLERTRERVTVTHDGIPVAVIVSPAGLESLEETILLLSDPEDRFDIETGLADLRDGRMTDLQDFLAERRGSGFSSD